MSKPSSVIRKQPKHIMIANDYSHKEKYVSNLKIIAGIERNGTIESWFGDLCDGLSRDWGVVSGDHSVQSGDGSVFPTNRAKAHCKSISSLLRDLRPYEQARWVHHQFVSFVPFLWGIASIFLIEGRKWIVEIFPTIWKSTNWFLFSLFLSTHFTIWIVPLGSYPCILYDPLIRK